VPYALCPMPLILYAGIQALAFTLSMFDGV